MSHLIENLKRHFVTAFVSLKRHLAMTLSAASAVMVTLILMALFIVIAVNINGFTTHVETNLKIYVSIDSLAEESQIQLLHDQIIKTDGVKDVAFSSKEDELNILIEESGSIFERYKENNPMPNVFVVEAIDATQIQKLCDQLNTMDNVDKAQYGDASIQNMIDMFQAVRIGGMVFIGALMLIAVFLIMNTIKMTIQTRRMELSIMRNVGAANWYIRTPFMIEGMFVGILGAIVPMIVSILGYVTFYKMMDGYFVSNMFMLENIYPFTLYLALLLLGCGALVGFVGSFFAVTKHLRYTR